VAEKHVQLVDIEADVQPFACVDYVLINSVMGRKMLDKSLAVKVENLSKIYRIGTKDEIQDNLAQTVFEFLKNPLKNYRKYRSLYDFNDAELLADGQTNGEPANIIWAVKDISFDVKMGEVVGIIGRNGAGKSTLLKILCRITDPTKGRARVRGRISSLLEVGTGFHQELTGRENVYLNGTILGMTKAEIKQKFDEIVDFSGVERFIDTPVKRYSSGMKVRLAFSVAAHLEPELLIIDEVLAVGDADFQKKCLNKMEDVGQQGRTVLFVSHNMAAVSRLCNRSILLENGQVVENGRTDEVIGKYLNADQGTSASKVWEDPNESPGKDAIRLRAIRVTDNHGETKEHYDIREPIRVEMKYDVIKDGVELLPNIYFWNEFEICAFGTIDNDPNWREQPRPVGTYTSKVEIPGNLLSSGRYYVYAAIQTLKPMTTQFYEQSVVAFQIVDRSGWDTARGMWTGEMTCVFRPLLKWKTMSTGS
jgi:lipopolysaccharide transport system ATP-binding protein